MKIASREDIPDILTMAMKFMETTGYSRYSDEETIKNLIEGIVTSEPHQRIIILEPGVGFIAGTSVPFLFGKHLLATEIAWWVEPDKRGGKVGGEMLGAFEHWAKELAGCSLISMVCLDDDLSKLYEKKGYKLYERAYMKVF